MSDEEFMREALAEADKARAIDEVPCGAIVVLNGEIIGRGHNTRLSDNRIYAHAEINAIIDAENRLGFVPLEGTTIYSTLEPCPMCAYALMDAHVSRLVYGAIDKKRGAISVLDIFNKKLGSKVEVCGNILEEESSVMLRDFFKSKR